MQFLAHSQEFEEMLGKLSETVKILSRSGYCVQQIHETGKYILATKDRTDGCKLCIKTFDNKPLHKEEFKNHFHILSGGTGGFCWTRNAPAKIIYCYRIATNYKYSWIVKEGIAQDLKMKKNGDVLYYRHSKALDDNSQCGILYSCSMNNSSWKTISKNHWVRYLNDSFIKYQFTNKSNNYLIINSKDSCSALLVLENQHVELFGNDSFNLANTAAINSKQTRFCLREQNLLLVYDLLRKRNTTFKVEPPEKNTILYYLFSPCDKYLYVFFENWLQSYHIKSDKEYSFQLPQPFKAIYVLKEPINLLFQSKLGTLYKVHISLEKVDFIKI